MFSYRISLVCCIFLLCNLCESADDDEEEEEQTKVTETREWITTRPTRSSRATKVYTPPATESPHCPYSDGGAKFKKMNMRFCFASCLDLIDEAQFGEPCKYNPATFNTFGEKCSGRFLPNLASDKKVFCNFDIFTIKNYNSLMNENLASSWLARSNLCTHILIYPLIKFDETTKKAVLLEDDLKNLKPHINELKSAGLKILVSIGNFINFGTLTISPKLFSSIARNDVQRNDFVKDVVAIVEKLNLDGVNIRWLYPSSPLSVPDGPLQDKINYITLLRNFTSLLKPKGLLVTTEGSANNLVLGRGIDIPKVFASVDYYLLFATDYHGTWMMTTGLSTPNKEVKSSIEFYKSQVNDTEMSKLIIGFRYGLSLFELSKPKLDAAIGAFAIIDKKSEMPWFQLTKKLFVTEKKKWLITKGGNDSQSFACNGEKWASFDDVNAIKRRVEMVKRFGLGGVVHFTPLDDDVNDELGCGQSPFLRTINEILRGFDDCVLPSCP